MALFIWFRTSKYRSPVAPPTGAAASRRRSGGCTIDRRSAIVCVASIGGSTRRAVSAPGRSLGILNRRGGGVGGAADSSPLSMGDSEFSEVCSTCGSLLGTAVTSASVASRFAKVAHAGVACLTRRPKQSPRLMGVFRAGERSASQSEVVMIFNGHNVKQTQQWNNDEV